MDNLTLNNASGVTLNADVTVNSTLTLTNGDIISTSSNKLSLKSSVSGGSSSSHISGPVDLLQMQLVSVLSQLVTAQISRQ